MTDRAKVKPTAAWHAKAFRIADAPGDDLTSCTTAAERFEMVLELSARMWELTGKPVVQYSRATAPMRVKSK
jgi:hypothetical protein